ncbi:hypothetical protein C8R31_102162 [Nitrosospira sp. Nsp2]|nr:hypothetical protein C8R31_102162 [Nitrosospira sp. Nsp2]
MPLAFTTCLAFLYGVIYVELWLFGTMTLKDHGSFGTAFPRSFSRLEKLSGTFPPVRTYSYSGIPLRYLMGRKDK